MRRSLMTQRYVCVSCAREGADRGGRWCDVGARVRRGGIGVKARSGDGCGGYASWRARGEGL
jgi:hypothetical protein